MPGHLLSDTEDDDHNRAIRKATRRMQQRQQRHKKQDQPGGSRTRDDADSDERPRPPLFGRKGHPRPSQAGTERSEKFSTHSHKERAPRPAKTSWFQILRVQLGRSCEPAVKSFKNVLHLLITTFLDALTLVVKACSLAQRLFNALIPRIVVQAVLIAVFVLIIVLACISVLVAFAVDGYCSAVSTFTWVPSQLTEFCVVTSPPRVQLRTDLSKEDTLEGWNPLVPSLYVFLRESFESVEVDLAAALALVETSDFDLSTGHFKDGYIDGISLCKKLEFEFMKQQRALWTNVDLFIREFPTDRPRQHWTWDRLGFVNKKMIEEAQELNKQLIDLLENGLAQTMDFSRKIPQNMFNTVFVKLFNPDVDAFRAQVNNALQTLQIMPSTAPETDDLFASTTVWSISSGAILDLLTGRGEMLKQDMEWLRGTLAALKEYQLMLQYGRRELDKDALEAVARESIGRTWESGQKWRARLKQYFAEGNI
ncbi:hypothetical protein N0V84_003843 [Fusarium piperis]|uniref:Uncharacterized protein n=1 Tax=Fusarium piperis TaxID=1435070 RepID=A0A9W8WGT8_9HYPO|nr:hypothetical protein N0V84_003843 [Fusarium piperis]